MVQIDARTHSRRRAELNCAHHIVAVVRRFTPPWSQPISTKFRNSLWEQHHTHWKNLPGSFAKFNPLLQKLQCLTSEVGFHPIFNLSPIFADTNHR
ncbi:MAG: hypothetical protein GY820_44270 [Gammaproteobacteria bacterium]|nr:hypothetical protein [Gammaproteobacteria bacterium]